MVGRIGHGKCFDCGVEPVTHWSHYFGQYFGVATTGLSFRVAQSRLWRGVFIVVSWLFYRVKPLHYKFSEILGIVRYNDVVSEDCSDRGKLVFSAAKERGLEIQQVTIYRKSTEVFRVRFPKNATSAGVGVEVGEKTRKTQWVYFDCLPLVPWQDRTYTQWIDDKLKLKEFLASEHINVPMCKSVVTLPEAQAARAEIQTKLAPQEGQDSAGEATRLASVVVKPRLGSRSRHTTIGVVSEEDMRIAWAKSHVIAHHIVVEEQLFGKVCRATLINGKLVGFTAMSHPQVVGDGVQTIAQLIQEKNEKRNKRVQSELSVENPDVYPLREAGYTLDTVLLAGEMFVLKQRAGWMYGGEGREMLNDVHPQLVKVLEKAAEVINAQLVAFDVIIEDPEADPAPQKWGIIEANSVPYIEVHIMPTVGERINVALQLWDLWKDIPTWWR